MAKQVKTDPLQDALISALMEITGATITHAMIQGGPEVAVFVIRKCIAGMQEQEQSILDVVREQGYKATTPDSSDTA